MVTSHYPFSPADTRVRVRTLGRFEIELDGRPLRFDSRGQRRPLELLKTLIACGGVNVPQERLCDALWPDADGDAALDSFTSTLRRLRKLVGAETLVLRNRALSLEPTVCWVDALAFESAAAPPGGVSEAALALYRGPFCHGEFEPGELPAARERLHAAFLRLVRELAQTYAHRGDTARAIDTFRKGLEADELAEDLVQGLLDGCLRSGRIAEGLAAYRRFEAILRTTVQVEPSSATRELGKDLRRAEPEPPTERPAPPPTEAFPTPEAPFRPPASRLPRRMALAAIAVAVLAVAGFGAWRWAEGARRAAALERYRAEAALPLPDTPSLVVLPLRSLGGGEEGEALADTISETITTDLVGLQNLFVIAPDSARTYKGQTIDVRTVGSRLGVRYVLQGSVQEEAGRLRVAVRLTDVVTGRHLWAERFDQSVDAPFHLIDRISRRIVIELEVNLTEGEQARSRHKHTASLAAYKLYSRGLALRYRYRRAENLEARRSFERALALDPGFRDALEGVAWTHWDAARYGWGESRAHSLDEAERIAGRLPATGDCGCPSHFLAGLIHLQRREFDAALDAVRKGLERTANWSVTNAITASVLVYAGQPQEAIAYSKRAMRLSPHYPAWYLGTLGDAYRLSDMHDEALQAFRELLLRDPDDVLLARPRLVALLAEMGRLEEARGVAARMRELSPRFSVARYGAGRLYRDRAVTERMMAQLRQAGLPD